ncbi:MAG: adenylosuccinate synthase [Thermoplasmata archaeon]|nr:adenylosuccinate synthase [Thermoplasmata archaeon]
MVVGAQFGDEAKGKISDFLAAKARWVVRSGGGPNAGHSIHLPDGSVVLHQMSVGVLRKGVTGVSGPGMVINPVQLETEIRELEQKDLFKGELVVSERAHAILSLHSIEDAWEEDLRQRIDPANAVGTTRRGIGPAYADRYGRWGIRFADLVRPKLLADRLKLLYASKSHLPGLPPQSELYNELSEVGGRLAPYVRPTEPLLWDAIARGESILIEGAQSALLDLDFGTYPYVTSSHPTSAGALVGTGIAPQELDEVIGVAKAYATRVGAGPFPTEASGEIAEYLQKTGGERGATTGRPRRCGWLDLVMLRYATRLNGFTSLALTKVDVLGGLDDIPVAVAYDTPSGERLTKYPPAVADELAKVEPVYRKFPAWPEFTARLKERLHREGAHALPSELRTFLHFVTEETGVPVEWLSFGPMRDDTLWLGRGSTVHSGISAWSA